MEGGRKGAGKDEQGKEGKTVSKLKHLSRRGENTQDHTTSSTPHSPSYSVPPLTPPPLLTVEENRLTW